MAGNDRRLIRVDRRYNQPIRLTGHAYRLIFKWGGLLVLVIVLGTTANYVGLICLIAYLAYAGYCITRWSRRHQVTVGLGQQVQAPAPLMRFNAPPGWPTPPGWAPPPGWQADPSWPPAPLGWQFWVPAQQAPLGERNTRNIPQDVKIQVAARDGGRCRQCGSAQDLHFDHVIPWSKGGANTVQNIQILCGPCNRRKGADDIPAWF